MRVLWRASLQQTNSPLFFGGSLNVVEKLFFYFENVVTSRACCKHRGVEVIKNWSDETFEYFYDSYTKSSNLSAAAKAYVTAVETFINSFGKVKCLEKKVQRDFLCSLDYADFRSSPGVTNVLLKKTRFDENAKLGLLRRAIMQQPELSQFII